LEHNYSISKTFSEVYSGLSLDRPKLDKVRDLIRSRDIDILVIYCLDRISRDPVHFIILQEECERYNVSIEAVIESIDNSDLGKLISYIRGFAAKLEAAKIRERSMRGKREKARQGKLATGGPRLYGYDVVEGHRLINDTESEVIKRIFNWFAEGGYTLYEAVRQLNQERIPRPAGGKWSENTIYRLLIHPAYHGVTYAFRYKCQLKSGKKSKIIRDMSEWIEIPGATPAIVSKEVYDSALKRLDINRHRSPVNRKHQYLFAGGRLRCGTCGHSMTGSVKKKSGKPWLYYRCICNVKTNYYEKCSQSSISASKVESVVWDNLLSILDNPDMILENIRSRQTQDPATIEAEEFLLKNTINKYCDEENRLIELYVKKRITEVSFETLVEKVRENIIRQEKKLKELRTERESIERVTANTDKLPETARIFSKLLQAADYPLKVKALEALDIKVTYTPDKVIVIDGLLPVGATNLGEKIQVENRNTLSFHFVCKEKTASLA
jgi:site-specific DNA recombinase